MSILGRVKRKIILSCSSRVAGWWFFFSWLGGGGDSDWGGDWTSNGIFGFAPGITRTVQGSRMDVEWTILNKWTFVKTWKLVVIFIEKKIDQRKFVLYIFFTFVTKYPKYQVLYWKPNLRVFNNFFKWERIYGTLNFDIEVTQ